MAELKQAYRYAGTLGGWSSPRFTAVAELKPFGAGAAGSAAEGFSTVHRRGRIEAGHFKPGDGRRERSPRFTAVAELKRGDEMGTLAAELAVLHGSPPWPN